MFTFKYWCFTSFQAITSVLVGRMWQTCDLKLSVQILLYTQNLLSQRFFQFTINYFLVLKASATGVMKIKMQRNNLSFQSHACTRAFHIPGCQRNQVRTGLPNPCLNTTTFPQNDIFTTEVSIGLTLINIFSPLH